MAFDSYSYAAFLVLVLLVAAAFRRRAAAWLVLASYGFYALFAWWYPLLLFAVCAAAWICGNRAQRATNARDRSISMWLGIGLAALPLLLFKYAGTWLSIAGASPSEAATWQNAASWLMPVGLSFYALQAIAWIVDSARGDVRERPPFLRFLLFFSFFPKLSAGPILRHDDFFPSSKQAVWSSETLWQAACLLVFGLFKKVVLADNAAQVADSLFAAPDTTGFQAAFGVLAYSMQIYCDFAGYTDLAIGSGLLLGIRLPKNFNWPYLSTNPAEFWRRWHITLSTWLRDYIFFAVPGIRSRNRWPAYGASMLTMFVCGVWHGSTLPFVVWGIYWGFLLVIYRMLQPTVEALWTKSPAPKGLLTFASVLLMQGLVAAGWVVFRAENLETAGSVFASLFAGSWDLASLAALPEQQLLVALMLIGFWLFHWKAIHGPFLRVPSRPWHPASVALLLLLLSAAAVLRLPNAVPFVYFRF